MNLTLETVDIPSVKIQDIVVKHLSIEQEIRNGTHTYKHIEFHHLPVLFEGFMWAMKGKTMIAIRGNNLDFQIVIMNGSVPKYLCNLQAMRQFIMIPKITHSRTEESIRLTKTINNTEAKITLNAKIIV